MDSAASGRMVERWTMTKPKTRAVDPAGLSNGAIWPGELTNRPAPSCRKRSFSTVAAARAAHRHAGWRVKTYWCETCRAHHVTNVEKRR